MRRPRVLIIGHYGGHNTGDEAMLGGLLRALPAEWKGNLVIARKGGGNGVASEGRELNYVPCRFFPLARQVFRCEGVVLGGGTHFHDDYAQARYLRHFLYMARIVAVSWLGHLLGRQVLWLGIGFGPLRRRSARYLTVLGLQSCDWITVRDEASFREIAHWVRPGRLARTFDLAALLPVGYPPWPSPAERPFRLGISVTSAARSRSAGREVDRRFHETALKALGQVYREFPRLQIRIFVLRGGKREDDGNLSFSYWNHLREIDPRRVELRKYDPDPARTLRAVAGCSHFLATRFHAGLMAYLAGCRMLLVAYHRKVQDQGRELGLPERAVIPVRERPGGPDLLTSLRDLLDDSPAFVAGLARSEAITRARANLLPFREPISGHPIRTTGGSE
ncbi:MAG: polysaccharide pyruvyl transferase family protein [Acidobacteria bacterium]|nr:polysaccharide pyruvyl transferase family protein [Acidobacteriota bacterium]